MKWNILCEVSGGVTGNRTALLTDRGKVVTFKTHDAAADYAKHLADQANGNKYRTATFKYTAQEAGI